MLTVLPAIFLSCAREEIESAAYSGTEYNMTLECSSDCQILPLGDGVDTDTKAFRYGMVTEAPYMQVLDNDGRSYTFSMVSHEENMTDPDLLTFRGIVENPSGTFRAIFPYQTDVLQSKDPSEINYVIPSVQKASDHSIHFKTDVNTSDLTFGAVFDYDNAPSTTVKLKPLGALVRFRIEDYESQSYQKIIFDAKGVEIAGSCYALHIDNSFRLGRKAGETTTKVELRPANTYFNNNLYLITVFPANLANGFKIEMYKNVEDTVPAKVLESSNGVKLSAGTALNIGSIDVDPEILYRPNEADSEADDNFVVVCKVRDRLTTHGYPIAGQDFSIRFYCPRKMANLKVGGHTATPSETPLSLGYLYNAPDYFYYETGWISESESGYHSYEVSDSHGNVLGSIGIYVAENNLTPIDVPVDGSVVFCSVGGDTHQLVQFDDKDFMHYFTLSSQPSDKSALTLQSTEKDNIWHVCNITENDKPKYLMTQKFRPIAYTTRDTAGVKFWGEWTIETQQDRSVIKTGNYHMAEELVQNYINMSYIGDKTSMLPQDSYSADRSFSLYEYKENLPQNQ